MTKDEKPKPVVYSPPDDPLGIDTDKDFNEEARRIARDAIEGRHEEAVQAEVQAALRRWGMPPSADLSAKATAILDRAPDVDAYPGDEIVAPDAQGIAELDRGESVTLDDTAEKARAIVDAAERSASKSQT
ncbi:hypothetical protein [Rhizobium leguminosarum]|uniref:hypothetical protein n=1 Tax=Rhizobium leguminosarum TaxID=384 RepID=UPI00103070B2|nr:hypothetical protein [Rhizobium leguminosarum]TBF89184.1 hypothetical protein ELG82_37195 [Rhizobium leguminosarum]